MTKSTPKPPAKSPKSVPSIPPGVTRTNNTSPGLAKSPASGKSGTAAPGKAAKS